MATGTVKFFSGEKGFGFIKPDNGGDDVFVHISELQKSGINEITEGDRLDYQMAPGKNGRLAAAQVARLG
ncbi:cold shock domain-containing protein [Rhizobium laguerreae]|uniref:cold-shock protein n=1 Tax=Rhizobium laguerreae TaxID=1076926 RepID=UPI001C90B905|nr:cold shock domain-containing protein [Rhizobium laguerreae]MBY3155422.1 cold shock domain-containing protein [Rhizobium laguerreae]